MANNFFDEAVEKLEIDPTRADDFAVILLEFLDDPRNFFFVRNLTKETKNVR